MGTETLVVDEDPVPQVPKAGWHSFAQYASVVPLSRVVNSQSSGQRLRVVDTYHHPD